MQVETALFFETIEQLYQRVFQDIRPRSSLPKFTIRFRRYASATSRIRLVDDHLRVDISDLLETAPAPVQEALAYILLGKLYRKPLDPGVMARYRRYLNRSDIRLVLQHAKKERGWKQFGDPKGQLYDLSRIFDALNLKYFEGQIAKPTLGWSLRPSRTTLGHYDPSHHMIVISSLLDCAEAPPSAVWLVMFHEMLHLKHPTEHRGDRRCVHTQAFKAAERVFENYEAAKADLRKYVDLIQRRQDYAG